LLLGAAAEALRATVDWKFSAWPKVSVRWGRPYQPFILSEN